MKRRPIPQKVRDILQDEPNVCARANEECAGSIEWEHALTYSGRNIQEVFSIIKICQRHHGTGKWMNNGGVLDKSINRKIAMARATEEDRKKYPRLDWKI